MGTIMFKAINNMNQYRREQNFTHPISKALKGSAENNRQINRKFGVEFLGNSFANLYRSIDNISNFA